MAFYVYMMAGDRNGTLYTGSTDNLIGRVWQHREKVIRGFTSKYGVDKLVWFEAHDTRHGAFVRERRIKKWNRLWELELIEKTNTGWRDLFETLSP